MIENQQQLFNYSSFIKSTDISAISSILITKMGEVQSKLEETFFEKSKPEKLSFETSKLNTLITDELKDFIIFLKEFYQTWIMNLI